ncbi:UNVERIFIED_CONTAM: hypothetical protein GTU68_019476, partial [Idotea baltica]|nr:hypothetical protein [Idotea baltica]
MLISSRSSKISILFVVSLILASCTTANVEQTDTVSAKAEKPNILLIVADDLGMADIGAFGSEIRTPSIDQIAHQGVTLTNFYTSATCSPTRSMLMS